MITGPLCKAARALAEVSRSKLAGNTGVDEATIAMFEQGVSTPSESTINALGAALEELGVIFVPEEDSLGAGVRLKFNRSITERIGILEDEGGLTAKDNVP
jgi:transcriptional regulator with XRE-family HTH domain